MEIKTPIVSNPIRIDFMGEKNLERHLGLMRTIGLLNCGKLVILVLTRSLFGYLLNDDNTFLFETHPWANTTVFAIYILIVFLACLSTRANILLNLQKSIFVITSILETLIVLSVKLDPIFKGAALLAFIFHLDFLFRVQKKKEIDLFTNFAFLFFMFAVISFLGLLLFADKIQVILLCPLKVNLMIGTFIYCLWFSLLYSDSKLTINISQWFGTFCVLSYAMNSLRNMLQDLEEDQSGEMSQSKKRSTTDFIIE